MKTWPEIRQGIMHGKRCMALSIRQPWAWAIIEAGKDIENRDYRTSFRGTLLVHASRTLDLERYDIAALDFGYPDRPSKVYDIHIGGFIGAVDVVDCVSSSTSPWFFGEFGWVLANPRPLPFLPWRGMPGLFPVEARRLPA